VSFSANRVGGASLAQTVTVLVAVGVFEVVAVRWGIKLQAKLLNYFLGSNKSNINLSA